MKEAAYLVFLLGLFFHPEVVGDVLLLNIVGLATDHTLRESRLLLCGNSYSLRSLSPRQIPVMVTDSKRCDFG
jgi:hypothetical protein